ncbi:MAG: PIN domain-containing protein [Terracidiphilus sp.]
MSSIVLDSSAALAMILGEPGGVIVMDAFLRQDETIAISAVNWSEVLVRMQREMDGFEVGTLGALLPGAEVVPFGQAEAEATARLALDCSSLSLGDRACLALAKHRNTAAWTTDKIWARMNTGTELRLLR